LTIISFILLLTVKFSDVLNERYINLDIKSKDKEGAIKELLSLFPLKDSEKEAIFHTIMKRESLGTTGIGKGIAIPHTRTLILKDIVVLAGVSKGGVDFDAIDKKPVHFIFLIVAPPYDTNNRYLITLGHIAELSREISKNMKKCQVNTKKEFIKCLESIHTQST